MSWVIADLLMFCCSAAVYLAVRKASVAKLPTQFNNLAMFAIPLAIFIVADVIVRPSFAITVPQGLLIFVSAVVLSYAGNAISLKSIELAPNPGYSLVLSKSYVLLTSILAVPLFGAHLTAQSIIAILLVVGAAALVMITPGTNNRAKRPIWALLALGSFMCWGFLSLVAKYLTTQGIPTLVFLTYLMTVVLLCILVDMRRKNIAFGLLTKHFDSFALIGVAAAGFNFFNFYAISIAPNVGYVNATNMASIGLVTILSALLFKDELTPRKSIGVAGMIVGMLLLFMWK